MTSKVAFLDRDGVINQDYGYVYKVDHFIFCEGVIEALQILDKKKYRINIVTNQSGIARGYYTEEQYLELDQWLKNRLEIDDIYLENIMYCPHHPDGKVLDYAVKCDCRKPSNGMIEQIFNDKPFDRTKSIMVGDKISDAKCGASSGLGGLYLISKCKDQIMEIEGFSINFRASLLEIAKEL